MLYATVRVETSAHILRERSRGLCQKERGENPQVSPLHVKICEMDQP